MAKKKYNIFIPTISCASCTAGIESSLRKKFLGIDVQSRWLDKLVTIEIEDTLSIESIKKHLNSFHDVGTVEECELLPTPVSGTPAIAAVPQKKTELAATSTTAVIVSKTAVSTLSPKKTEQAIANTAPVADIKKTPVDKEKLRKKRISLLLWRALAAALLGLPLFVLCLLGITLPWYVVYALPVVCFVAMAFSGYEIYRHAIKSLYKTGTFNMDSLFTLSTALAFGVSVLAICMPAWGIPLFFEAGLLILGFRNVGLAIDEMAKHEVRRGSTLSERLPTHVQLVKEFAKQLPLRQESKVSIQTVKPNDIITIKAGDMIPLDGTILCVGGAVTLQDTIISGDFSSRVYGVGQTVRAGMVLMQGQLDIQVTHAVDDCLLSVLDKKIATTEKTRPQIELSTTKLIHYFVPFVLGCALVSAALIAYFFNPVVAISTALSTLVVACPCVLGFIVPLSGLIGRSKAAAHGAYFTDGKALQDLSYINTIVLDKTGTLTEPKIVSIDAEKPYSRQTLLRIAMSLEQKSEHVIAQAINRAAKHNGLTAHACDDAAIEKGLGVAGTIDGRHYFLGNSRLLTQRGIDLTPYEARLLQYANEGKTVLFLVEEKKVAGLIILEQRVKPDTAKAISALRKLGCELYICTGGDEAAAKKFAKAVDLPEKNLYAECSPAEKLAFIEDLQKKGRKVAMVGDGANDAAALARAQVGIAMLSGDRVAQSKAEVVVSDRSLMVVVNAIRCSKMMMRNIHQSLTITFVFNAVMIAIAGGALLPWGISLYPAIAAGFMIVQSMGVLLNALWFKHKSIAQERAPLPTTKPTTTIAATENTATKTIALGSGLYPSPTLTRRASVDFDFDQEAEKTAARPSR